MDNKYSYTYEKTSDYCYHNSDVLINKLNIKTEKELFIAEQEFVSYRVALLLENPIKGDFDFDYLKAIHKFLFQDIFSWAGKTRTCNISKTNLFCLAPYIDIYAKDIFDKISKNNYYLDLDYKKKIEALTNLFADINALHPFREGNGRTQREFIKGLAKIIGINLDFTQVDSKEMIVASSESIVGNIKKLLTMFKKISVPTSKDEQLISINNYIKDKKLAIMLKNSIKENV
jgi:cell filamentation protein